MNFFVIIKNISFDIINILKGCLFKKYDNKCYNSFLNLHCTTNGLSTDIFSVFKRIFSSKSSFIKNRTEESVLKIDGSTINLALSDLKKKGFYVFPNLLDGETCDNLVKFAKEAPLNIDHPSFYSEVKYYEAKKLPIAGCHIKGEVLWKNQQIQKNICDSSLLAIAQKYLGVVPIIDILAMWWTFPGSLEAPSSKFAQKFHFDLDRIKWLKFFIYLTDVESTSGPHVYVEGSHKRDREGRNIRRKGYVRIEDNTIEQAYGKEKIIEITGKRGTMFLADTRAFHKGKTPVSGDRLVLQIEYCNSLFGLDCAKNGRFLINKNDYIKNIQSIIPNSFPLLIKK
jgi:hypothetical protein